MTVESPYDDRPYYGRFQADRAHAPLKIAQCLAQLGLAGWTAALLGWLRRYDGLEKHLGDGFDPQDPRLDPMLCVRDVLLKHVAVLPVPDPGQPLPRDQMRSRIEAIIDELLQMEFVATKAFWGSGNARVIWNPLAEDWLTFIEHGPTLDELRQQSGDDEDGLLHTWISASGPDKRAIRQMLLGESGGAIS